MLSPREKKSLEAIHRQFLTLEKASRDGDFDQVLLTALKSSIEDLKNLEHPDVTRLADLSRHLVPSMTLRHFSSFALPFERLLHKNIQDDDFLVLENDTPQSNHDSLPLVFVLDNLRSAFNVGSIFRTAECLGAEKVYLCGYTPPPTQGKVEKTAMGTQNYLSWESAGKISECLAKLKEDGYRLVALETTSHAQEIYAPFVAEPTAFILGNERFGLDPEILKFIDDVRIIPLRGRKNSLNVGVSAAVAGFEWVRQWQMK